MDIIRRAIAPLKDRIAQLEARCAALEAKPHVSFKGIWRDDTEYPPRVGIDASRLVVDLPGGHARRAGKRFRRLATGGQTGTVGVSVSATARADCLARAEAIVDRMILDAERRYATEWLLAQEHADADEDDFDEAMATTRAYHSPARREFLLELQRLLDGVTLASDGEHTV